MREGQTTYTSVNGEDMLLTYVKAYFMRFLVSNLAVLGLVANNTGHGMDQALEWQKYWSAEVQDGAPE